MKYIIEDYVNEETFSTNDRTEYDRELASYKKRGAIIDFYKDGTRAEIYDYFERSKPDRDGFDDGGYNDQY